MAGSSTSSSIVVNQGSQQTPLAPINIDNREKNTDYYITLYRAIQMGDWEKAQEFINKDGDALTDKINISGFTALHVAIACKQHIWLSKKDGYINPFEGENGVSILTSAILVGFLDIAYDILKEYPILARTYVTKVMPALFCIAKMWDAFPSAKRYNFYQRFVYSHVPAENQSLDNIYDIENQKSYKAKLVTKSCIHH
ncbi:hypothetical protein M8C21_012249, partial [Ambrosia artemisiifolia]